MYFYFLLINGFIRENIINDSMHKNDIPDIDENINAGIIISISFSLSVQFDIKVSL